MEILKIIVRGRRLGPTKKNMNRINLTLTIEELRLLASLASDQLFRRQFIDPRMPGYKGSREEVEAGKALVGRMRLLIDGGARPMPGSPPSSSERKAL